jgi:hypothetical protein
MSLFFDGLPTVTASRHIILDQLLDLIERPAAANHTRRFIFFYFLEIPISQGGEGSRIQKARERAREPWPSIGRPMAQTPYPVFQISVA